MIGVLFIAVAIFAALWLWQKHGNTLFVIDVEAGRMFIRRGDVPATLMHAMSDACRFGGFREGSITAWKTDDGLVLRTSPRDEGVEQRLRNTVGTRGWTAYRAPRNEYVQTAKRAVVWTAVATLVSRALRR